MRRLSLLVLFSAACFGAGLVAALAGQTAVVPEDPVPLAVQVDTSGPVPSDAVILFNGKDLSKWRTQSGDEVPWKIDDDGAMVAAGENIYTKEKFGDVQLHFEWSIPKNGNNGEH